LFRIIEHLALALKNRAALKFSTALKYFLLFRIFHQRALALKTDFALNFFKTGGGHPPPTSRLVHLCAKCESQRTEESFFGLKR